MAKLRLDQTILKKMGKATKKDLQYVREQISRRASRSGISSEAAQIIWASQLGIGSGRFLRSLQPHLQEQVRQGFPENRLSRPIRSESKRGAPRRIPDPLRGAVDLLLRDPDLRKRCGDLLKGRRPYDRVVREATTILDSRLKKLGHIRGLPEARGCRGYGIESRSRESNLEGE
jgi:hypothetical protein